MSGSMGGVSPAKARRTIVIRTADSKVKSICCNAPQFGVHESCGSCGTPRRSQQTRRNRF